MPPVVLICIDGLDPEYLENCDAPNLKELGRKGFFNLGESMMPSVTNVNNMSIVTGVYPEVHGICSNYWYVKSTRQGYYTESSDYVLTETMFVKARKLGLKSLVISSKDKLMPLLSPGVDEAFSAENPPDWAVELVGMPPSIYSLEVNGWIINAATAAMVRNKPDLVYITTTDYAMHLYPPQHLKAKEHMKILDDAIGQLIEAHSDVTLLLTADHGMSEKNKLVDLKKCLSHFSIQSDVIPIIKDRYIVHHSNLGGCMYVYIDRKDYKEAIKILNDTDGVEEALSMEDAQNKFRLHTERIGDIVVTGRKDVVFGDESEVTLPSNLRSHGSTHERSIPLLGYNGDFDNYSIHENRDMGRYIFEKHLS